MSVYRVRWSSLNIDGTWSETKCLDVDAEDIDALIGPRPFMNSASISAEDLREAMRRLQAKDGPLATR